MNQESVNLRRYLFRFGDGDAGISRLDGIELRTCNVVDCITWWKKLYFARLMRKRKEPTTGKAGSSKDRGKYQTGFREHDDDTRMKHWFRVEEYWGEWTTGRRAFILLDYAPGIWNFLAQSWAQIKRQCVVYQEWSIGALWSHTSCTNAWKWDRFGANTRSSDSRSNCKKTKNPFL